MMNMIVYVFDQEFNKVGRIDSYISLQWTEDYRGKGSFTMVCTDAPENSVLLQQGHYLYRSGKKTAMIIRYVKHDSEESIMEIRGYTLLDILSQRIVYPVQTITEIEKGMYSLVETFCMSNNDRRIASITTKRKLNGLEGFNVAHETQFTGHELTEALADLAAEGELGYYMEFDYRNKRNVFTVYRGEDRTQGQNRNPPKLFAVEYGSLQNVMLTDDMTIFKNVAYVAGAGEGLDRKYIVLGNAKDLERFELYVDARDLQQEYRDEDGNEIKLSNAQYEKNLKARGTEKLNDHIRARSFSGEINPAGFGTDFYLGDKVSCKSDRYRTRLDAAIMQYTEVIEENMMKLEVSLGNPEITLIQLIQEVRTWL